MLFTFQMYKKLMLFILSTLYILSSSIFSSYATEKIEEVIDNPATVSKALVSYIPQTFPLPVAQGSAFKLGFEFQEITGLCPWAKGDNRVQKKKIFEVFDAQNTAPLWHLVLDSSDIEFVTEPFSDTEEPSLTLCMTMILKATEVLEELLKDKTQIKFDVFFVEMFKRMNNLPFKVKTYNIYEEIKDKFLCREEFSSGKRWTSRFAPQVTIQHPLENTIFLYFSLYGFDTLYMDNFSTSLPLKADFLEAQKEGDNTKLKNTVAQLRQKLNGLVFLHALTMTAMSPAAYPRLPEYVKVREERESVIAILRNVPFATLVTGSEALGDLGKFVKDTLKADTEQLEEILEAFKKFDQIDPKIRLLLMSRRPFSQMFQEVKESLMLGDTYEKHFTSVMLKKNLSFCSIPDLFNKVNYGEQFFDPDSGMPCDLRNFSQSLEGGFFESNKDIVQELLQNGIISTTMVRNLKKDIKVFGAPIPAFMEIYFPLAVKSVDTPRQSVKISINDSKVDIQALNWPFDILSPPVFLEDTNSMGRFKQVNLDKRFGEAIVEVRGIKSVSPWFLRKCSLNPEVSGAFLVNPKEISSHALALFQYLKDFGTGKFDADIEAGFSHAFRQ